MTSNRWATIPGADDPLPGENWLIWPIMPTTSRTVPVSELAPLGDRHIGELRDVAHARFCYLASAVSPAAAALTPEQRHKAWSDWRLGPQCQQILLDVASGEREFADALEAVFMAGIEAALRK